MVSSLALIQALAHVHIMPSRSLVAGQVGPRRLATDGQITHTFKPVLFARKLGYHDTGAVLFCAGYASRSVLRGSVCDTCRKLLTVPGSIMRIEAGENDTSGLDYQYIRDMDRGGLTYPSKTAFMIAEHCLTVLEHLTSKYERSLIGPLVRM